MFSELSEAGVAVAKVSQSLGSYQNRNSAAFAGLECAAMRGEGKSRNL